MTTTKPVELTPTSTASPTITPTPIPLIPTVTAWNVYHNPRGVSIEYPANWQYYEINTPDQVVFKLDAAQHTSPYYWFTLLIYDRPFNEHHVTDPHTWPPNEGGYEVHWERPISIDGIPGIEFIWGSYREGERGWVGGPDLYAILYSKSSELDIRLWAGFDGKTVKLAMKEGFEKVIKYRYTVFEHMLQSIRITPSTIR